MKTHKPVVLLLFSAMLFLLLPLQAVQADSPMLISLQQQVQQLQAQVNALQAQLAALQANSVLQLDGKLSLDTTDANHPIALFTGVNVQIVNGLNTTATTNGLGNLIVGYNEALGVQQRGGSHNLVVGDQNNYTSYGMVVGFANTISARYATVSGGVNNSATGNYASVSGGFFNSAIGNTASGSHASVLGGYYQNATADYQTIPALP